MCTIYDTTLSKSYKSNFTIENLCLLWLKFDTISPYRIRIINNKLLYRKGARIKTKKDSLKAGLNHRPFAYKANALPLSY